MSTQYDEIGKRYASIDDIPTVAVEKPSVSAALGDVQGLNCLDLACGLGKWSKFLLEQGAAHVVGIDISSGMITGAQEAMPEELRSKADFHVADCSQPIHFEGGPFGVVFAAWFLNYAPTYEVQVKMWRNIYQNLKPGGRFVGIVPNINNEDYGAMDGHYGIEVKRTMQVKDGYKCRLTAYTEPKPVTFEMYHLHKKVYEGAAAEAGLVELIWHGYKLPDSTSYWDAYKRQPEMEVCTARRPSR